MKRLGFFSWVLFGSLNVEGFFSIYRLKLRQLTHTSLLKAQEGDGDTSELEANFMEQLRQLTQATKLSEANLSDDKVDGRGERVDEAKGEEKGQQKRQDSTEEVMQTRQRVQSALDELERLQADLDQKGNSSSGSGSSGRITRGDGDPVASEEELFMMDAGLGGAAEAVVAGIERDVVNSFTDANVNVDNISGRQASLGASLTSTTSSTSTSTSKRSVGALDSSRIRATARLQEALSESMTSMVHTGPFCPSCEAPTTQPDLDNMGCCVDCRRKQLRAVPSSDSRVDNWRSGTGFRPPGSARKGVVSDRFQQAQARAKYNRRPSKPTSSAAPTATTTTRTPKAPSRPQHEQKDQLRRQAPSPPLRSAPPDASYSGDAPSAGTSATSSSRGGPGINRKDGRRDRVSSGGGAATSTDTNLASQIEFLQQECASLRAETERFYRLEELVTNMMKRNFDEYDEVSRLFTETLC